MLKIDKLFLLMLSLSTVVHFTLLPSLDRYYFHGQQAQPEEAGKKIDIFYVGELAEKEDIQVRASVGDLIISKKLEIEEEKIEPAQEVPTELKLPPEITVQVKENGFGEIRKTISQTSSKPSPISMIRKAIMVNYFKYLSKRIERKVVYPRQARRQRQEGTVLISFTLHRDGEVSNISIKKSSGFKILDYTAFSSIKMASPFPAFPSLLKQDEISLCVPVNFRLSRKSQ